MGKKRKASQQHGQPTISLEELKRLHDDVRRICHETGAKPGSFAYSILCSLGACMGFYPRVKTKTVEDVLMRYRQLTEATCQREVKAKAFRRDLRESRHERIDSRGLPCERCGGETSADDFTCLYGNYWLCPQCVKVHRGVAANALAMNGSVPKDNKPNSETWPSNPTF